MIFTGRSVTERRNAAQHLSRILELNGYSVWFDYGLLSGSDFGPQIERELRAAKAVIVLWCTLSHDSKWVLEEAHLAEWHLWLNRVLYFGGGVFFVLLLVLSVLHGARRRSLIS